MWPPTANPTKSPLQDTSQVVTVAATSLEIALGILQTLTSVTENVPYLNAIAGAIQKLIKFQKAMTDNKKRADDLLNNIGNVSCVLAQGLRDLDGQEQNTAILGLKNDLERYQIVLDETHDILQDWKSKGFVKSLKRALGHGDFPDIASGIDRQINAFRDAFSGSRLIALSTGQDAMDRKLQTLVDENKRKQLKEWLQPANVALSDRDAADKCHPGTGLWLLETTEFKDWIYAANSFLWLEGISGSGKTVLSSTIINALRSRAEPIAFFYFDTNNSGQRTVKQLLSLLVIQISLKAPHPDKTLHALWSSYANGEHLPSNSALISDALIPILGEFIQPVYIVLDALDECSEHDKLLDVVKHIVDAKLANVHLLLTSRPEIARDTDLAKQAVSVSLDGCVDQDIEAYVTEILSKLDGDWPQERKNQIKAGLLERGGGMFRLVSLQLGQLLECDGSKKQVNKALSNMPASLEAIYDRILENIKNPDMLSSVGRTMNWLILSKRPMQLNEIIDVLAFDFDAEPVRFSADERMRPKVLLSACAGFVTVSEDPEKNILMIKLAHASVKEYFLSAKGLRHPMDCQVSMEITHYLMAQTCIAYLCSFDHVLDKDSDLEKYPLAQYAAENWSVHLRDWEIEQGKGEKLEGQDKQLIELVLELLQPDSIQYKSLFRLHDIDNSWGGPKWNRRALSALYLSATIGISPKVVQELISRGAEVNALGGDSGNALQAASWKGHIEIVHLLLDQGAEVNAQGGLHGYALQAASSSGHIEIVHLLLNHGVEVNAQGRLHGYALQAASSRGHIEIVHLLLNHGAKVNAQSGYEGNALQAASLAGHNNLVRLLLDHGAEVNAQGGLHGYALQAASSRGHIEIVHLLLDHGAEVNVQDGCYGNALQAASLAGHNNIVCLLLNHGAEVNRQGGRYVNALQAASWKGHIEIVRLLLDHGAEVNVQDREYGNALQTALEGHSIIVQLLLDQSAEMNAQGGDYGNALQAASWEGHIEIVRLLLNRGAEVNAQGGDYGNALQGASLRGHIEVVRLLLDQGAEVNAQGGHYGDALQAASLGGHIEIVHLLLELGAVQVQAIDSAIPLSTVRP
ncbi:ectomycorrhiza-induced ankyrin-domain/NACHT-domain-containing protein [Mycena amicta]|nr:ectomycorrhiza-induced ankyrin-domain/NACHT-domain-containing protein [Mycena amicta]